jgi:O-antigen ligase
VLVGLGLLAAAAIARDGAAHRARIGPALAVGLAIGVALLAFDHASWNLFRRAVRGLPDWTPFIGFGLKPAVSLLALLLPLVLAVPGLSRLAKAALVATGLLVALWLPAESAKLAVIAGLLAAGAAALAPGLAWRAAAAGLAGLVFATPLLFALLLPRLPDLSPLPASAAHRVLIWDFVLHRVAERPILGWGMEASRAVPEGTAMFTAATLDRFGLESEAERARFLQPFVQRLPLHPHNAPLQIWLELGLVGAAIAAGLVAAVMRAVGRGSIAPAALGAAVSGLVTALLSFGVWQPWWIASLVLAALIVAAFSAAASPRSAPAGDRAG